MMRVVLSIVAVGVIFLGLHRARRSQFLPNEQTPHDLDYSERRC